MRPASADQHDADQDVPSGPARHPGGQRSEGRGGRQGEQPGDDHLGRHPQCTAPTRRPAAVPRTEPLVTCVVDSANPSCAELRMIAVLAVSAANPCRLSISLIRWPRVRMIRQPPVAVPARWPARKPRPPTAAERRLRQQADGDQRQGDHAHRLLCVVRAVGQGDHRRRHDLRGPESAGHLASTAASRDAVGDGGGDQRGQSGHDRREGEGTSTLPTTVEKWIAPEPAKPRSPRSARRTGRARSSTACRTARSAGSTGSRRPGRRRSPGGDPRLVDEPAGDGQGHLDRQERPEQIQRPRPAAPRPGAAGRRWRSRWPWRWPCRGTRW